MQVVVKALEKTFAKVHISDWVDLFRYLDTTGNLAVAVSPVVLDTLHVPLVDHNDNFVALGAVDLAEELFVLLVDEDLLELGEEDVS